MTLPQSAFSATTEPTGSVGDVGAQLLRAADCLHAALGPTLADCGLNEARYGVLEAIQHQGAAGCSQSELAGRLLQSESNLSTLLERMRLDGLIVRERSSDDRRKSVIHLSPSGERTLHQASTLRGAILRKLFDGVEPPHHHTLATAMPALLRTLENKLVEQT